jgi:hypothetical protein
LLTRLQGLDILALVTAIMTISQQRIAALRKRLNEHRLREGLSFEALATQMAIRVGAGRVSMNTVRNFITGRTDPHEITVLAVEAYLNSVENK